MLVEVAGSLFGVEDRARFVVGEFFEEDDLVVVFGEDAIGGDVAWVTSSWKPRVEAAERSGGAGANAFGAVGIGPGEECKAFAEASCVLVGDGEDSDTALRAAGAAYEVRAAAEGCVS
jgi:hypothetical protein